MRQYVDEIRKLAEGSPVKGRFAVRGKEAVRDYKNKEGKFFFLEICDRTGAIGLKYWGGPDPKAALELYNSLHPGDVVMLTGSVSLDKYDNVQVIAVNEGTQLLKRVEVKDETVIREFANVHRGTAPGSTTAPASAITPGSSVTTAACPAFSRPFCALRRLPMP